MKITSITYPVDLKKIKNLEDDSIDVFVELDDKNLYVLVVTTPSNYYSRMEKSKINFIKPGPPDIIVRSLKKEIIEEAIYAFLQDDAYWLKLYFLCGEKRAAFGSKFMDALLDEIKIENDEIFGK